jgi:acetylornithine deacetylase/succinyl-diaminopimelate desuccinylase-like protein
MEGYQIVKKAIETTFKDLYVAPYIITTISDQRYLTRVSDCVIRFSPLYYPYQSIMDAENGNEHIMKKSLTYGIDLYKEIIKKFEGLNHVL